MKFLVFGDVVGRPGREAITKAVPDLRKEYEPDVIIVNIENMAHNKGISPDTWDVAKKWEADCYTTGDHAWDNDRGIELLHNKDLPIIRPANYPDGAPGKGYFVFNKGAYSVAVINLQGQVFFKNQPLNPFFYIDDMLNIPEIANANIKLLDFHADATSEKKGMGWYVDGRISAVWGTHTHIPTADAQVLPQGTGYISDVGMNGLFESNIGADPAGAVKRFLTQLPSKLTFDNDGPLEIGGLMLDIDPKTGRTTDIAHIRKIIDN